MAKNRKTTLPASRKVISVNASNNSVCLHSPPNLPSQSGALKSERVQRWKLNEQVIASRRLKNLKVKESDVRNEQKVNHKISLIHEDSSKTNEQKRQQEHWEEYIRSKQERQFNITRITKFFID